MKKLFYLPLVLLMVSFQYDGTTKGYPQSFSEQPDYAALQVDASRLARIDSLLQEYVDKGIIPHALTFVAKSGQVIHNKAFGWRALA